MLRQVRTGRIHGASAQKPTTNRANGAAGERYWPRSRQERERPPRSARCRSSGSPTALAESTSRTAGMLTTLRVRIPALEARVQIPKLRAGSWGRSLCHTRLIADDGNEQIGDARCSYFAKL